MSAAISEFHDQGPDEVTAAPPPPVVVRRNAGFAALVGLAASTVAIAYLWRAVSSAAPLDWALCAVMAGIAAVHLAHLVDARTPLLVADELGVRIRLGNQWRGLPWDAVASVLVRSRRGLLRDGRLLFAPYRLARALDGLDARGRRAAALNQKMYGAALAVPLGVTSRASDGGQELADRLAALVEDQVEVVVDQPGTRGGAGPSVEEPDPPAEPGPPAETAETAGPEGDLDTSQLDVQPLPGRRWFTSRSREVPPTEQQTEADAGTGAHDETETETEIESESEPQPAPEAPETPARAARSASPLRELRRVLRADTGRRSSAPALGNAALLPQGDDQSRERGLPEGAELRRRPEDDLFDEPSSVQLTDPTETAVAPIARLVDPVDPPVIGDFVTEPAYDPVIGPELAAARTRVGLSVDDLAERTRIRPHVIEAIEVDDFAPCGGDFYARGHLRTLARYLGRDPVPMLAHFDDRYATAPINAKRVFEAELATGMTGSMRRTSRGGPNWALLIGVVLVLVLVWAVVRLFASEPPEQLRSPVPNLNGSAVVQVERPAEPAS